METAQYRRQRAMICGALLCGTALLAPLAGCGGDGLKRVHGTVTYRGQSINKGRIEFWPPDGNGPTAAAPIINGEFSARVPPGRKLVKIYGVKVVGKRQSSQRHPDGILIDSEIPIVPERFNSQSELYRDITADSSIVDFRLDDRPGG